MLKIGDKVYVVYTNDEELIKYLLGQLDGMDTMLEVTDVDYEDYTISVSGYEFPISIDEVIKC